MSVRDPCNWPLATRTVANQRSQDLHPTMQIGIARSGIAGGSDPGPCRGVPQRLTPTVNWAARTGTCTRSLEAGGPAAGAVQNRLQQGLIPLVDLDRSFGLEASFGTSEGSMEGVYVCLCVEERGTTAA